MFLAIAVNSSKTHLVSANLELIQQQISFHNKSRETLLPRLNPRILLVGPHKAHPEKQNTTHLQPNPSRPKRVTNPEFNSSLRLRFRKSRIDLRRSACKQRYRTTKVSSHHYYLSDRKGLGLLERKENQNDNKTTAKKKTQYDWEQGKCPSFPIIRR